MIADDLVQETLFIALQRSDQLRDQDRLHAWLHAILSNCWRQHLRRSRCDLVLEENEMAGDDDPERVSSELELFEQVRRAILRLPHGQRQTITLVDLAGFSYAEVAEILDIPIGTVMSRLHSSRCFLQRTLARYRLRATAPAVSVRRLK
jgi:RNA polymerase sigma-70 factor (ECF subfamily)